MFKVNIGDVSLANVKVRFRSKPVEINLAGPVVKLLLPSGGDARDKSKEELTRTANIGPKCIELLTAGDLQGFKNCMKVAALIIANDEMGTDTWDLSTVDDDIIVFDVE